MSRGRRARKRQREFNKGITLLVVLVSIIAIASGSTLAILITSTGPIKNTFNHSYVACEVIENEFVNGTSVEKSNVSVQNTGDTESYIRAAIIVTWKDSAGNVYAKAPQENIDYQIDLNTTGNWRQDEDGFYYYTKPVLPGSDTDILIYSCSLKGSGLEGYGLSVEILASAIQSKPSKAVEDSWKVNVAPDGSISK